MAWERSPRLSRDARDQPGRGAPGPQRLPADRVATILHIFPQPASPPTSFAGPRRSTPRSTPPGFHQPVKPATSWWPRPRSWDSPCWPATPIPWSYWRTAAPGPRPQDFAAPGRGADLPGKGDFAAGGAGGGAPGAGVRPAHGAGAPDRREKPGLTAPGTCSRPAPAPEVGPGSLLGQESGHHGGCLVGPRPSPASTLVGALLLPAASEVGRLHHPLGGDPGGGHQRSWPTATWFPPWPACRRC